MSEDAILVLTAFFLTSVLQIKVALIIRGSVRRILELEEARLDAIDAEFDDEEPPDWLNDAAERGQAIQQEARLKRQDIHGDFVP